MYGWHTQTNIEPKTNTMYQSRTIVGFNYNFVSLWYILSVLGICSLSIYGVDHRPCITSRKVGDEIEAAIYTDYLKFHHFCLNI